MGLLARRPTPHMEDQGISFCLGHHLSGIRGPTSSYATASIVLRIIWPLKPLDNPKVGIYLGGGGFANPITNFKLFSSTLQLLDL
jgi:hypothetical protein